MRAEARPTPALLARLCIDLPVTLAAWGYYIFAFLLFFAPFYTAAYFCPRRRRAFQQLNHLYSRGLFTLLSLIAPRQRRHIDTRLVNSKGAVILCNHLSYLDPLLLMAAMPACATVVKARFFFFPIFGWVLRSAGYLPSSSKGRFARLMLRQMEGLQDYLATGGNLFVFPEGTRSRDGRPGPLQHSALKLARLTGAPIAVFRIDNTNALFPTGRFLFCASQKNTIRISYAGLIQPQDALYQGTLTELEEAIQALLKNESPPAPASIPSQASFPSAT